MEKRHRIKPIILSRAKELRHPLTLAEKKLWDVIRGRQMSGFKFRRQTSIGPFIADFFCTKVKLIVEIDGSSHAGREDYDAERTEWLQSQGYSVIRFTNKEVNQLLDDVVRQIDLACEELGKGRLVGGK